MANIRPETTYSNIENLLNEFGCGWSEYNFEGEKFPELKIYLSPDISWLCTDSYVGLRYYFLNNELTCLSYQIGRKYPEDFEWVSKDAFAKMYDYFSQIFKRRILEKPEIRIIDPEEDWGRLDKN